VLELKSEFYVRGLTAASAIDFMINCSFDDYQKWWPGTHLELRYIKTFPDKIGNVVYFDEYVGKNRLQITTIVEKYMPGKKILWRVVEGETIQAWMTLEGVDDEEGVTLSHVFKASSTGTSGVLDTSFTQKFTPEMRRDLHDHAVTEFNMLPIFLAGKAGRA